MSQWHQDSIVAELLADFVVRQTRGGSRPWGAGLNHYPVSLGPGSEINSDDRDTSLESLSLSDGGEVPTSPPPEESLVSDGEVQSHVSETVTALQTQPALSDSPLERMLLTLSEEG